MPATTAAPAIPGDTPIKKNLIAFALDLCEESLQNRLRSGEFPRPSVNNGKQLLWQFSEISAYSPALAERVRLLLEIPPLKLARKRTYRVKS
jgi:hypothetical protein